MIESTSNQIIVRTKKLSQKKYRYEYKQYLIEGKKLVEEAVKRNQSIAYVLATEEVAPSINYDVTVVSQKVLDYLSEAVTNQGVIAVLDMQNQAPQEPIGNCLILENLQDAGNLGTILRTAVACGYNQVYLINCVDPYCPKVMRSAMSAQYVLKIYQADFDTVLDTVSRKCDIICADMNGKSVFDAEVPVPHALLIGNEGNGVSVAAKQRSNLTVSLPMKNNLESLNASVCAGILMYLLNNK